MKPCKFLILFLLLFYISGSDVSACTIFTAKDNNNVLVGNNEDFMYQYSSDMWFAAASPGTFGRVCFANSNFVQGGMNEKGLFYDGASCPATQVPYSEKKPSLGMDLGEVVLSRCADVGEVVELLKQYNIPRAFGDHLLFADATGASVIMEWVDNKLEVIPGEGNYQIATNFFISKPELGGYPCGRFDTVKSMLEESKELSVDRFAEILGAATQSWDGGGTKYSNVYDLKNKKVYVYSRGDFSSSLEYDLADELKNLGAGERSEYDIDILLAEKKGADAISVAGQASTAKDGVNSSNGGDTGTNAGTIGSTGNGGDTGTKSGTIGSTGNGGDTGTNAGTTGSTGNGGTGTNIGITAATTDSEGVGKSTSAAEPDEAAIPQKTAVSGYVYIICGIAVFSAVLCIYIARRAARQGSHH